MLLLIWIIKNDDQTNFDPWHFRLADEKKEEGNQFYKQKQYREALSKYSEAIGELPQTVNSK